LTSRPNFNFSSDKDSLIFLALSDCLKHENIVESFVVNKNSNKKSGGGFVNLQLNNTYKHKTIVSDIYHDSWVKTINRFKTRATEKGVKPKHITMITDVLDDNAAQIINVFEKQTEEDELHAGSERDFTIASALKMVKKKTAELFLDEVKKPFIAVKEDGHIETMAIESKKFIDWLGGTYYFYTKNNEGKQSCDPDSTADIDNDNDNDDQPGESVAKVLGDNEISKVQSILSFEINKNANVKTLYIRAASFIDTDPIADLDNNVVYYDLCNPTRDIIRITRNGWSIEKNYPKILFKRYSIMNAQVEPKTEYPPDILERFMKLTNLYNDEDNKLLAKVYLISLFLMADIPKPLMIPHGTQGSGKSTFQEFIKLIVDPAAALTTAFPKDLPELIQQLSHTYLTYFDNVSDVPQATSDALCRAVTGSGFSKRGLYSDDDDFIYNMKRAVGFNGINITATSADLLERILNLHLQPIDKRKRRKIKDMHREFEIILPHLLGCIFDSIAQVLNRIGEVKLQELPRMADFAELGELIARCLGYPEGIFIKTYNDNIGFTNKEAIESNPVATAIINLMDKQAMWIGKAKDLKLKLDELVASDKSLSSMMHSNLWPKTPHAIRARLNDVSPNLKEIGIVVHYSEDSHTKTDTITLVNNNFSIPSPPPDDTNKEEIFWSVYSKLEKQEKEDPSNMSTDDKNTVSGSKLHNAIVSSGVFYQGDATQIIKDMIKANLLKEVMTDTYRRV
jgi:hypothetical protein